MLSDFQTIVTLAYWQIQCATLAYRYAEETVRESFLPQQLWNESYPRRLVPTRGSTALKSQVDGPRSMRESHSGRLAKSTVVSS